MFSLQHSQKFFNWQSMSVNTVSYIGYGGIQLHVRWWPCNQRFQILNIFPGAHAPKWMRTHEMVITKLHTLPTSYHLQWQRGNINLWWKVQDHATALDGLEDWLGEEPNWISYRSLSEGQSITLMTKPHVLQELQSPKRDQRLVSLLHEKRMLKENHEG